MATILAHIHVHAGREHDFEELVREIFSATHANETSVRHYEYWRGQEPGLYYCLLAFEDHPAFIHHQASDHHEAASPRFGDLIERMRLEWVDPVGGASPLRPSAPGALPAGASELEQRMARLFPVEVAEWWPPRSTES